MALRRGVFLSVDEHRDLGKGVQHTCTEKLALPPFTRVERRRFWGGYRREADGAGGRVGRTPESFLWEKIRQRRVRTYAPDYRITRGTNGGSAPLGHGSCAETRERRPRRQDGGDAPRPRSTATHTRPRRAREYTGTRNDFISIHITCKK